MLMSMMVRYSVLTHLNDVVAVDPESTFALSLVMGVPARKPPHVT